MLDRNWPTVTNHGHEVTFEIGWRDQMAGQVVWNRWTDEVDDLVMAFADVGFLFGIKDYRPALMAGISWTYT